MRGILIALLLLSIPVMAEEPKLPAEQQAKAEILALRIQLARAEQALAATGAKLQVCEGAINQSATAEATGKLIDLLGEQKALQAVVVIPEGYEFDWAANPPGLKKIAKSKD